MNPELEMGLSLEQRIRHMSVILIKEKREKEYIILKNEVEKVKSKRIKIAHSNDLEFYYNFAITCANEKGYKINE